MILSDKFSVVKSCTFEVREEGLLLCSGTIVENFLTVYRLNSYSLSIL